MASQAADRDVRPGCVESASHPEPACREAQKWIEAVTGKSFGDKDFRRALENGILLCELLSAIRPGLVKKINRLPTPIAGLDNLSVFLRGCEQLGLKGSQLFDPGDLQDTSIRANLKDSDCSRKLKNVLNTMFWLGKAARGCASYSGPTLNLKEFEGLLAQMKMDSEESADGSQKRSVRDSGYDCWDSERSESLSPPRHTRDNSLDSLDSFGSRSQHSPSPDVANRSNTDGRASDLEADAAGRKPDMQKDDMSARRSASGESRSSIPFNQFLPNRSNASSYVLNPRRKSHVEDGEQRSHGPPGLTEGKKMPSKNPKTVTWAPDSNSGKARQEDDDVAKEVSEPARLQKLQKDAIKVLPAVLRYSSSPSSSSAAEEQRPLRSPSPNIVLRRDNDFLSSHKAAWDSSSDGEGEAEGQKVPDVRRDDLASRRAPRGPVAPRVHQFVPSPACSSKDRERWEGIRRSSQQTLSSEGEKIPDMVMRKDSGPRRRQGEEEEVARATGEAEDEGGEGKVKATPNVQTDDLALRRAQARPRPLHRDGPVSLASAAMSKADLEKWEKLRMTEPSEPSPAPVCQACLEKTYTSSPGGRGHRKSVTFGGVTEIGQPVGSFALSEGSGWELLRRLLSKATVAVPTIGLGSLLAERERSLTDGGPPCETTSNLSPGAPEAPCSPAELDACLEKRMKEEQEEEENEEERTPDVRKDDMMARRTGVFHKQSTSAASYNHFLPLPASKRCPRGEVGYAEVDWMKNGNVRGARDAGRDEIANVTEKQDHVDDDDENEPVPVLEKDDMMARRTAAFHKSNLAFRQFLPMPGALKYNATTHAPAVKQANLAEKVASESSGVGMVTQRQTPPPEPCPKKCIGLEEKKVDPFKAPASLSSPSLRSEAVLAPCREAELGSKVARAEERMEESKKDDAPRKKAFWVEDDDLPPIMVNRRVALMSEDAESVSLSDIVNEDEAGHFPHSLSVSRHERMHEQYNSFQEEDDQWRSDLARWKTRRRCTSQELIKKEEERKRMERMKEEGGDCNRRKSIKTYKEIVEDKERREAELCEAYRNAATPEEAAMVLQRYALRFTISDATLDYLKLPRSTSDPEEALNQAPHTQEAVNEMLEEPASTEEDSMKCEEIKTVTLDTFSNPLTPTGTLHSPENTSKEFNQRPILTRPEQLIPVDAPSQPRINPPEVTQMQPPTVKPVLTIPSPSSAPSRPVPLLAAKPYCQPRSSHGVKMDGLVRINGDSPASPSEKKDFLANEASSLDPESVPEMPDKFHTPLQASSSSSSSSSFSSSSSTISSLFSGRNCITKTTIVTELTQTVVEPHQLEVDDQMNNTTTFEKATGEQPARSPSLSSSSTISIPEYSPTVTEGLEESSVSIETPMLNLAKRVNHWVWDPNEERKRVERWQQEQERLLQEQYQKEQEKLKKEWEKAQLEVREQERKHNEEERKILEETVAPLQQQLVHPGTASPASHDNDDAIRNLIHEQNGQKEDQHVSKLQFLQDSSHESETCKKQDMWKTTSLDRNLQPNLPQGVKRCDSHEGITAKQQQLPPSPTRCVSGKRLCSGCSQPLGKGAAMIIDTLGLFFHMQCFKCGLCEGQLGDVTTGTDVRIRNGLLTCHDCYISSRGRGQPTTL
ncbi:LIM and calponin homology domains-containing protein 1a isoform X3 [Nerophis ophidion]|uniref:LIM and calponin homology domains-containing protein 1a isoform X3 n=1 Tax=Nerophis ophidion TaxID=159077 RepID=UPI002AE00FE4|nr:LIM and calponin homology domains-containing protein 1a isoform X3 [Nerophis ophidion]